MNINLTLFGQSLSFFFFVWFSMRFIWPLLRDAMAERQQRIAEGLENAEQAARDLAEAHQRAGAEVERARQEAQAIIEQARGRAARMIDEAKEAAREEGAREIEAARAQIEQEKNSAREELREQLADLVVRGAERIVEASIDRNAHQAMLNALADELRA